MRPLSFFLAVLAIVPAISNATSSFNVDSVACSGSQTSSIADVVTLSCSGDFSLSGGRISSDKEVSISSLGVLSLDNLFIFAPTIKLAAYSTIWFGPDVALNSSGAPDFPLGEAINLLPAQDIQIVDGRLAVLVSSVPEPSIWLSMLAGLVALGGFLRFKKRHEI